MSGHPPSPLASESACRDAPPFSHAVEVATLPPSGRHLRLTATDADRAALAGFLDVPAVSSLTADLAVTPLGASGRVRVEGRFQARLRQMCGITLAEIDTEVSGEVTRIFSPDPHPQAAQAGPGGKEIQLDCAAEDPPDPLIGGRIDLGQVIAEELALGLDPFPRAPGATFAVTEGGEGADPAPADPAGDPAATNPFAVLAPLRKKPGS